MVDSSEEGVGGHGKLLEDGIVVAVSGAASDDRRERSAIGFAARRDT